MSNLLNSFVANNSTHWYQSTLGIILVGLVGVVVMFVLGFVGLTLRYTWLIKQGKGPEIADKVKTAFTALSAPTSATQPINRAELETSVNPVLGNPQAPITIVEFVDFKCPNCKLAAPILAAVAGTYSKDVKIMVRHFPIESLHPGASRLALFAECANQQGVFWPAYNILYTRQDFLSPELTNVELSDLATTLSLDPAKLASCMLASKTMFTISRDYSAALDYGVRGTPTFFVNGTKWEGVVPLTTWKNFIESNRQ